MIFLIARTKIMDCPININTAENNPDIIFVRLAGVTLQLTSDLKDEVDGLRSIFRYHLAGDGESMPTDHTVMFTGSESRVVPQGLKPVWAGTYHAVNQRGVEESRVSKYISPDGMTEYYETREGECIVTDLKGMTTTCVLCEKKSLLGKGKVRSQVGSLLILMVHIVMAYHRRYTMHASAVELDGKGYMFTGISGQGKSTLSTDLAALKTNFMGDDIVFLYQQDGQIMLGSLLFEAKLYESSKKRKDYVDVLSRTGGNVVESVPLQGIADVKQTRTGKSQCIIHPAGDMLFSIILRSANSIAMQYDKQDWLELCGKIAEEYTLKQILFGNRKELTADILKEM